MSVSALGDHTTFSYESHKYFCALCLFVFAHETIIGVFHHNTHFLAQAGCVCVFVGVCVCVGAWFLVFVFVFVSLYLCLCLCLGTPDHDICL